LDLLRRVGFVDVEMVSKVDVFKGAEGQQRAEDFGTVGANIRAQKP
jgi:hypothetical protein